MTATVDIICSYRRIRSLDLQDTRPRATPALSCPKLRQQNPSHSAIAQGKLDEAKRWFDEVLDTEEGEGHLEALMGRVKVMERLGQVAGALDALNRVAVIHPSFVPAVAEKAKMRMRAGDWDAALETAQGILERDPKNIDALRLRAFYLLGSRRSRVETRVSSCHARGTSRGWRGVRRPR